MSLVNLSREIKVVSGNILTLFEQVDRLPLIFQLVVEKFFKMAVTLLVVTIHCKSVLTIMKNIAI